MTKVKLFSEVEVNRESGLNWKTFRSYKKAVKRRNGNKCVKCDSFENLECHHIQNYAEFPELRLDLNNSVPMCHDCHQVFHILYGYSGNGRRQLKDFLGEAKYKRCRIHDGYISKNL